MKRNDENQETCVQENQCIHHLLKIHAEKVDEALMDHPFVKQAITFPVKHKRLVEDVAAVVVLKEKAHAKENEIRNFLFNRLADFKIPSQIVFSNEIPQGPTGKPQRIGLAERL